MPIATGIMRSCASLILFGLSLFAHAQESWVTPFERDSTYSAHYDEVIRYYAELDSAYDEVKQLSYGSTDVGKPLQLLVVNTAGNFDPAQVKANGKAILMVMNGIHPGESCGVDASMMWVRDMVQSKSRLLDSVVLAIIPIYNVGGALERSCCTRANQNGPIMQGFRGNGQYLDLNRDCSKADSRNMKAFTELFHQWRPQFFIDTHTSNGADYQHTMTLIGTQRDKLQPLLAEYLYDKLWTDLFAQMEHKGWPMTPYVMPINRTPDNGLLAFLETPRYSTGYTALFNTIGFVTEAHMFKPFDQRVWATYAFLQSSLEALARDRNEVLMLQRKADQEIARQRTFHLQWEPDTSTFQQVVFNGYTDTMLTSRVSGHQRLHYMRHQPWSDSIRWYDRYQSTDSATAPLAYIIPQAWQRSIQQLQANDVQLYRLTDTITLQVEVDYIEEVTTLQSPWEGHYFHREVATRKDTQRILYQPGDYVVFIDQWVNRYIVEMLEPTAADSWFRWNYFDAILMQKEYFSGYVFDPMAADYLDRQPDIRAALEAAKKEDPSLADNHYRQLDFVYKRSPYYERSHKRYPVARLRENVTLPLNNGAQ